MWLLSFENITWSCFDLPGNILKKPRRFFGPWSCVRSQWHWHTAGLVDQGICARSFILVKLCGVWGNAPPVRNLPSAALTLHSLTKTELWWDSAVADCGAVIWEAVTKISIAALMRMLPCGSVPSPQDLTSFLLPLLHWSASLVGRCDVAIPFMAEHFRALAYRNSQCLEMHAQDLYKIKRD